MCEYMHGNVCIGTFMGNPNIGQGGVKIALGPDVSKLELQPFMIGLYLNPHLTL